MKTIKQNYPIYDAPKNTWKDILNKIWNLDIESWNNFKNKKNKYWLISRFFSYKKVLVWVFGIVLVFSILLFVNKSEQIQITTNYKVSSGEILDQKIDSWNNNLEYNELLVKKNNIEFDESNNFTNENQNSNLTTENQNNNVIIKNNDFIYEDQKIDDIAIYLDEIDNLTQEMIIDLDGQDIDEI